MNPYLPPSPHLKGLARQYSGLSVPQVGHPLVGPPEAHLAQLRKQHTRLAIEHAMARLHGANQKFRHG